VVLRGDNFQADVGWYCADDPPGAEVFHPFVTGDGLLAYHEVGLANLPMPVAVASGASGLTWVTNQVTWYDKSEPFPHMTPKISQQTGCSRTMRSKVSISGRSHSSRTPGIA
jgi:hypothetical protein